MDGKVLVAYGSKYGATAEIADKIGEVLRAEGIDADVVPADEAREVERYEAVVVGSGVYYGRWRKNAASFIKKNAAALAERPTWLFSSGPTGEGDPAELTKGWISPKSLEEPIGAIKPREVVLFGGSMEVENLNSLERMAIKKVEAPVGDFRDWDAIATWAKSIAAALNV